MGRGLKNGDGVINGVVFSGGLPDDPSIAEAFGAPLKRRRKADVETATAESPGEAESDRDA
jgi:hypothetical protein